MSYPFEIDGQDGEAEIIALRPALRVRLGAQTRVVTDLHSEGAQFQVRVDGTTYQGWRCRVGDAVQVRINGRTYTVGLAGEARAASGTAAENEVRASMPGVVVAVHCEPGQRVQAGDHLLTLESMKLQMTVVASHAATVQQLHVAAEAVFERGALLVSLAPEEAVKR